jgi:hypothetical protein
MAKMWAHQPQGGVITVAALDNDAVGKCLAQTWSLLTDNTISKIEYTSKYRER